MSKQTLKSVYLNPMINVKKPHLDLLCPVFKFGRKRSDEFRFPVIFKNEKKAIECLDELRKLVGKQMDEVKKECDSIYKNFEKYHYQ